MNLLENIIINEKYPAILMIFGEEEFLIDEAASLIIQHFSKIDKSRSDLELLDGNNITVNELVNKCQIYPFILPKRVVVVNNFESLFKAKISKKLQTESTFTRYLNHPSDTTFLIIKSLDKKLNGLSRKLNSKKVKPRISYPYNLIVEKYPFIEYPKVWDNQISSWIIKRIESKGSKISPEAAELFSMYCNSSLRELNSEIEKLLIYSSENKIINLDTINKSIGINRKFNVFELQKAVSRKDINKSLLILQKMLSTDRLEVLILTILTNFFVSLLKLVELKSKNLNDYQIARELSVHPMFVKEYINSLNYFNLKEIESAFNYLVKADIILKTTSTNSIYTLEKTLLNIMTNHNNE